MFNTRLGSVVAGILLTVLCANNAGAVDACASSDGVWQDATGQWNLYQNSNGLITGTMINNGVTNGCTANHLWTVTGHMNNDGSFTYTAVYSLPFPRPEACATTITLTGSIFKPGCNNSSGTWINNSYTGVFSLQTNCHIPTETTPQFKRWGSGPYPGDDHSVTVARFEQNLNPTSFNYGGRYVQEFFLADTVDTCYFGGSNIPQLVTMPPKPRINMANQLPAFYPDYVGMTDTTVSYYRSKNISPCGYYLKQRMKTDCDIGEFVYQVNDLEASQDPFGVFAKRGASVRAYKSWGTLPPRMLAIINSIINLILED